MTLHLCDFCGGEIGERYANFVMHDESDYRKEMLAVLGNGEQLRMCEGCLGHLLPISERIRRERIEAAKQQAVPPVGKQEMDPYFSDALLKEALNHNIKTFWSSWRKP